MAEISDCLQNSTDVEPDPDIAGIGVSIPDPRSPNLVAFFHFTDYLPIYVQVVVSYVATAFMTVLAVAFFYCTTYDPREDPFGDERGTNGAKPVVPFRPNPMDLALYDTLSKLGKMIRGTKSKSKQSAVGHRLRAAGVRVKPFLLLR